MAQCVQVAEWHISLGHKKEERTSTIGSTSERPACTQKERRSKDTEVVGGVELGEGDVRCGLLGSLKESAGEHGSLWFREESVLQQRRPARAHHVHTK